MKAHKNCGGFSLIELLCTIAIMGVILSISYPSISAYFKFQSQLDVKTTSEQLLFDIRDVRQQNMSQPNTKYTLYVYGDHYIIQKSSRALPITLKTVNAPNGVTFKSNIGNIESNGVYFSVTGAPSSAGTIYINGAGFKYTLTIQPSTGRAAIVKKEH